MKKDEEIRKRVTYSTDFYPLLLSMDKVDVADVFLSLTAKYIKEPLQEFQSERAKVIFEVLCNDYDKAYEITHTAAQKRGQKGAEKRWHPKDKPKAEQQQQPELFKEEAASEGNDVPLVEAEEVEPHPFEFFWREYISHKDELNARRIWKCLPNDLREKAINGAKIYTQYVLARKSKDPNFDAILKPSSFLKDAHWNDEYKEEELTPQNNGNNRSYQSDYEHRKQQQNAVLTDFMAEAAARVQANEVAKNRGENI